MDVPIPCLCPGTPHEGDTVTLRDTLDFHAVTAIRHAVSFLEAEDTTAYTAEVLATLTEGYVFHGIASWTLVGDDGKPLPASRANIRERLLPDVLAASAVGDAADELYGEKVLLPLLVRASTSSATTPTETSTSPRTDSPKRPRTPSSPSSTTSTRTAATATTGTSPVGASSS